MTHIYIDRPTHCCANTLIKHTGINTIAVPLWKMRDGRSDPWCLTLPGKGETKSFETLKEAAAQWKAYIRREIVRGAF